MLLSLKNERYYGLDEMGTRFWTGVTSSSSLQEAYDTLLEEYDVDAEALRKDLQEFLDKLVAQGLIEIHDEAVA